MRKRLLATFRRNEIYLVAAVIGVVFMAAMGIVAWMLQGSVSTPPYEVLGDSDLKKVFATGYLRFREDDGTPYLKVELHNGTLWWIKKAEFDFDGVRYLLHDSDAFRPLHFGAVRCILQKAPPGPRQLDYDLNIVKASGYPPAEVQWERSAKKVAAKSRSAGARD
ncbi:MAG: hypothetical protein WBG50_19875 [Desulfomonilaceae bacterium]